MGRDALERAVSRLETLERETIPAFRRDILSMGEYIRHLEALVRAEAIDEEVSLFEPPETGPLTSPAGGEGKGSGGAPPPPRG